MVTADIQAIIFPILTAIINEDPDTQEDIIQSNVKRFEQETAYDHTDHLFCKWADETGHFFEKEGVTKSLYNTLKQPDERMAEWNVLHQNVLAVVYNRRFTTKGCRQT